MLLICILTSDLWFIVEVRIKHCLQERGRLVTAAVDENNVQ